MVSHGPGIDSRLLPFSNDKLWSLHYVPGTLTSNNTFLPFTLTQMGRAFILSVFSDEENDIQRDAKSAQGHTVRNLQIDELLQAFYT